MEDEGIELASAIAAARLLVLTSCRLGEIMTLKWEHVDLAGRAVRLLDSKTGAKVVHLGQPAIDVLSGIKKVDKNSWVIVGPRRRPADRSSAFLAARPRPPQLEGRPDPRPPSYLCLDRRRLRAGVADDRQATRPHPGSDKRPVRPYRGGSGQDCRRRRSKYPQQRPWLISFRSFPIEPARLLA